MAKTDRIEVYRDDNDEWRWRYVRSGNNERMATSGEGYRSLDSLREALQIVFEPAEIIYEIDTMQHFLIWRELSEAAGDEYTVCQVELVQL